jgi:hypothetical protein
MRALLDRTPEIVNGVTEQRRPLLIHNLCVFRQDIYSAPKNFCRTQELCALRGRRQARLRAAKPGPSV